MTTPPSVPPFDPADPTPNSATPPTAQPAPLGIEPLAVAQLALPAPQAAPTPAPQVPPPPQQYAQPQFAQYAPRQQQQAPQFAPPQYPPAPAPASAPPPVPHFSGAGSAPGFRLGSKPMPPLPPGYTGRPGMQQAPSQGFAIAWWALLAAAPMVVLQFVAARSAAEARGLEGSKGTYIITSLLWPAVFAVGLSAALWWMCGRSRKVSAIVFLLVYLAFTVPDVASLARGPRTAVAEDRTVPVIIPDEPDSPTYSPSTSGGGSGSGGAPARPVESGGMRIVAKPGVRRTVQPVEPVVTAPPKPVAPKVLTPAEAAKKASDAVREAHARMASAAERWASTGGLDWNTVKSEQELAERIEAVDALAAAVRGIRDTADSARNQLKSDLAAARIPPARRDNEAAVWAADMKLEEERQATQAAERFLNACRNQYALLQREWGKWWVDPQTGRVGLKNQQMGKQFDRGAGEVEAARKALARAAARTKGSPLSNLTGVR